MWKGKHLARPRHVPIRRPLVLLAGLVSLALHTAYAVEPPRPDQENFISRAVFDGQRLWLRSDAGALSTVAPGETVLTKADLPDLALDVCAAAGVVQALTCPRGACSIWTLRRKTEGRWTTVATVRAAGDTVAALNCAPDGRTVTLTNRRLIEFVSGVPIARRLSQQIRTGTVTSTHVTPEHVFVGVNAGEWGGGLRRIDRKTGRVSQIEKAGKDLCEGPLNTACDPVNAITDDPWKPGCVLAAIGLVHFSPHGRIVQVCGNDVRRIYFRGLGNARPRKPTEHDDEPFETEAFFGIARAGMQIVAVGVDGIYRFDAAGPPLRTPLPSFEPIGGIEVSFATADVILVLTGINQRRSISGNVPLLVPR